MTKEDKYKKALLEARAVLDPCLKYSNGKVREALESIDKELKSFESEDERIRKELIEYHKQQFEKNRDQEVGLFHNAAIAYLEKQEIFSKGEGLYYYRPDGDCTFIGTGLGPIEDITLNGERPKTENKGVDLPGACLCVEKQKEPHKRLRDKTPWIVTAKEELAHDEERLQANLEELHRIRAEKEKQKEQKPVEPSDDELQRHQDELYDFKVFAAKQAKEHHISFVHDFEWNNFCAELLSYFNEQKPAWSEEDSINIRDLIGYLNGNAHFLDSESEVSFKKRLIYWLSSLRPQYHGDVTMTEAYKMGLEAGKASSWKPSEEQMEALKRASTNEYLPAKQFDILVSLYEQLKKL